MESFNLFKYNNSFLVLLTFLLFLNPNCCHGRLRLSHNNPVAFFIFGDSVLDVGNNNYINTTSSFQSNFRPYGESFFHHPTGRFSNGRIIPDFISAYAKLPLIPPYMNLGYHQIEYGVNFASAGAGALVETFPGRVINLKTQVDYFRKVKKSMKQKLGDKEAERKLSRAVYLISIGSNDYFSPSITNSSVFKSYSRAKYVEIVIGNLTAALQEIYGMGGRKFGFVNMGPLGCLPIGRAINRVKPGECLEKFTTLAKLHNIALSRVLQKLERNLQGFKYANFDVYTSLSQRMKNPSKYGFKEGKSACCGSGPYRGATSCGGRRGVKEYELCSNANEYVFFDAAHETEKVNRQYARLMWSGTPNIIRPYNLKALFEL